MRGLSKRNEFSWTLQPDGWGACRDEETHAMDDKGSCEEARQSMEGHPNEVLEIIVDFSFS